MDNLTVTIKQDGVTYINYFVDHITIKDDEILVTCSLTGDTYHYLDCNVIITRNSGNFMLIVKKDGTTFEGNYENIIMIANNVVILDKCITDDTIKYQIGDFERIIITK